MLHHSAPSSSSSKISTLRSDDRISEPDPVVRFGQPLTPNFSIRDYVFASRSKNSEKSWPFPCWLLELFVKHGVEDLLPPFDSPRSLRRLSRRSSEPEIEKILINSPLVGEIVLPDKQQHTPTQAVSCLPSDDKDKPDNLINECEIGSSVTTHNCDIDKLSRNFGESVAKKRRLILPVVVPETNRTEAVVSTSIASDPMASKVCPVCKTFSSTSNTTLNAHMDQCLSMASGTNLTVDEIPKVKVKMRKKRLMEDIYATASHCSLEDLDRRNGTSWAASLNLVSVVSNEANLEAKILEPSQVDTRDERSEGAVYVDSNGIKLRILSKFNNASQIISRKNIKHVRDGKIISVSKKKIFGEKHIKKLKLKMENRKLRSSNLFKTEAALEAPNHEEVHQEERLVRLSDELNQDQANLETATLQRWPSSKRSDLPKKMRKKDFVRSLEHSEPVSQMKNLNTIKSASGPYPSARRHIKLTEFPESEIMDFTPSTLTRKDNREKNSRNDEFCVGNEHKLNDSPPKTIRISALSGSNSSSKKISKYRSVFLTANRRDFSINSNGEQQRCAESAIASFQDEHITGQDAKQSCSKLPFINSKSLFDKFDNSSMTAKSLNGEGSGLLLGSDDKLSPAMPTDDCEMMMEQLLLHKQHELIPDRVESRDLESEAGALSTESSACLTSHGDLEPSNQRENFSIASPIAFPNQGSNSSIIRDLSGSPTSNSFLFNTSPKASEGELGRFIERNQQFRVGSVMNKPQQQSDYHHCCCSYQSIMARTMPASNPKTFPNLYIKPNKLSTVGGLRSEMVNTGPLFSPTGSMMARACSNVVGSTSPSCGTPLQSSSNSILRLMGKDLMVSHDEESSNPPKSSNVQSFPSPLRFASCPSIINHESFPFTVRSPSPSMTDMKARSHLPCVYQSNVKNKAYRENDVNVIDGSSSDDMMMRGALFPVPATHTMFRSLSPYMNGYLANEGMHMEEVSAPFLPRPFMFRFPSTTQLNAPFYYP